MDRKTAKSMNKRLGRYLYIQSIIKPLGKELGEIRAILKDYLEKHGSFATEDYLCAGEARTREGMCSFDKAAEILQSVEMASLLLVKHSFILVHVAARKDNEEEESA
jgi:hypothetical protein